jgi:ssDNA-binding Zn-finger/Zn-ribbon topoisomerase 1
VIHLDKKEEKWEVKARCPDCELQMTLITKNMEALVKGSIPELENRCPHCGWVLSEDVTMLMRCPECGGSRLTVSQVMPVLKD